MARYRLLHHPQLHEDVATSLAMGIDRHSKGRDRRNGAAPVSHVPEPLSPSNRTAARNCHPPTGATVSTMTGPAHTDSVTIP